jgi:hypothetical protein
MGPIHEATRVHTCRGPLLVCSRVSDNQLGLLPLVLDYPKILQMRGDIRQTYLAGTVDDDLLVQNTPTWIREDHLKSIWMLVDSSLNLS